MPKAPGRKRCRPPRRPLVCPFLLCSLMIACGPPAWPGGIHAQLVWSADEVRVVGVPEGSVAAQAGLREGDRLLAIDGESIEGLDSRALQSRLTGEVGSRVKLRVARADGEVELEVARAPYGVAPSAKADDKRP